MGELSIQTTEFVMSGKVNKNRKNKDEEVTLSGVVERTNSRTEVFHPGENSEPPNLVPGPEQFRSVTKTGQESGNAPLQLRFSSLSRSEQNGYAQILFALNRQARLFAPGDQGQLKRIEPMEARNRLDEGQPVYLVAQIAAEHISEQRDEQGQYFQQHFFAPSDKGVSRDSESSRKTRVVYSTSVATDWSDLLLADPQTAGVPGTPVLPASGGVVVISSDWEKSWYRLSEKNWGIFNRGSNSNVSSGQVKAHYRAS
ncbi:MAG: hypothetical protein HYU64_04810 [Armatimonadetes bacterium]|nr:hypothetical protein [Armatimonadota bacterium]